MTEDATRDDAIPEEPDGTDGWLAELEDDLRRHAQRMVPVQVPRRGLLHRLFPPRD